MVCNLGMPSIVILPGPGCTTLIHSFVSQAGERPLSVVVEFKAPAKAHPKASRASARRRW